MQEKEKDMNGSQLKAVLQYVASMAVAYVVGKGWLPTDVATELAAWIVAGIPVALAIWSARDKGKVAAAAQVEGVSIVAPDAIASTLPATNVVSGDTHSVLPTGKSAEVQSK